MSEAEEDSGEDYIVKRLRQRRQRGAVQRSSVLPSLS